MLSLLTFCTVGKTAGKSKVAAPSRPVLDEDEDDDIRSLSTLDGDEGDKEDEKEDAISDDDGLGQLQPDQIAARLEQEVSVM